MTIQNLGSKTTILGFIPNDVVAATKLGSAIDLTNYEGDMVVLLDAEAGGASITYAVKLTASDTSLKTEFGKFKIFSIIELPIKLLM